jgi:hypothetical protein
VYVEALSVPEVMQGDVEEELAFVGRVSLCARNSDCRAGRIRRAQY